VVPDFAPSAVGFFSSFDYCSAHVAKRVLCARGLLRFPSVSPSLHSPFRLTAALSRPSQVRVAGPAHKSSTGQNPKDPRTGREETSTLVSPGQGTSRSVEVGLVGGQDFQAFRPPARSAPRPKQLAAALSSTSHLLHCTALHCTALLPKNTVPCHQIALWARNALFGCKREHARRLPRDSPPALPPLPPTALLIQFAVAHRSAVLPLRSHCIVAASAPPPLLHWHPGPSHHITFSHSPERVHCNVWRSPHLPIRERVSAWHPISFALSPACHDRPSHPHAHTASALLLSCSAPLALSSGVQPLTFFIPPRLDLHPLLHSFSFATSLFFVATSRYLFCPEEKEEIPFTG
jgi:hypothetical protein